MKVAADLKLPSSTPQHTKEMIVRQNLLKIISIIY